MKLIILLLLPCLAFGMSVPSSGGMCVDVSQHSDCEMTHSMAYRECQWGQNYGGAQSVDCKPLPVDILQLTPQEQAWFLVFMVVAFVIIEAGNG